MHTRFESLGAFLPEGRMSTAELVERMAFKAPFNIEDITGIHNRRVHDKRPGHFEGSLVLGLAAARDCLKRSRYRAEDLDVIVSVSISRMKDGYELCFEPSFALELKRLLGATKAITFDLSNACAGMMSGVMLLDQMIKAGIVKNGIVISGECITTIAETAVLEIKEALDPQFGSLTVGDSGAAVVVDEAEDDANKIHHIEMLTAATGAHFCIGKPSDATPGIALYTDNKQMHNEDRVRLWPTFQMNLMEKWGTTFEAEKYDYVVQHQVSVRAIQNFTKFAGKVFNTTMPEALSICEEYGNTATTSHFIVLYESLRNKRVKPGSKFLLVPAASGLVTGFVGVTVSLEIEK